MTDEQMKAMADFETARKKISQSKAGKHTNGLEAAYAKAYQRLVKLGLAVQLRGKYRRG